MNIAAWLLAIVIAGVGSAGGGYLYGHADGAARKTAEHNAQAVEDLTGLINSHKGLITQASAASRSMRQALASRALLDTATTKEFKDALNATADSRSGCVFDAGVMRQLATARDRAAQAAAGGIHEPVPGATTGSGRL